MNAALPLPWRIHRIYQQIAQLDNLSVNEQALRLFGELLALLRTHSDSDLLKSDPFLQSIAHPLRRIFALAAFTYEKHWAEKLLEAPDLADALQRHYPYREHYERATRLEYQALTICANKPVRNILMVGSGPLPMTSIQLLRDSANITSLHIDNLDVSAEANDLAQKICGALDLNDRMAFIQGDILRHTDLHRYDAIWLAALAGDSHNKIHLLQHLHRHMRPESLLLVRTACNLRALIYPAIEPADLSAFQLRLKIQTYSDNFHSMYLVQR